jgi:EAL and modified HD-GYP domain-containing signal transduction protein
MGRHDGRRVVSASVAAPDPVPRVLFARQAIVDRRGGVYGYELLYRGRRDEAGMIPDAEHATCQVLVGAFAEVGFTAAVGGGTAFVNVTERFLREVDPLPLAPERTVLEILEDARPSPELLERLAALRSQGFRIALDDFHLDAATEAFLPVADIVKIDVRAHAPHEAAAIIRNLAGRGLLVVGEKVEDQREYAACRDAGAKLFQGFYFCKPLELVGTQHHASSLESLRIAASLTDPDAGLDAVEHALRTDPALSLRLLRHLNSGALSLPHRVTSLRHGMMLIGPRTICQWALVMVLSGIGEQRGPLVETALARAKTCELVAQAQGAPDADAYFAVGLLSVCDALAGGPMAEVVGELPLAEDVHAALVDRAGPKGAALAAAIACERGELPTQDSGLVLAAYADAVRWADQNAVLA